MKEVSGYRPDIDGLRAVAVLAVVVFHAFPGRLPGGFTGVDIFFVISGFLISGIITRELEKGTFSLLSFYRRRVRRIFPALLLVMMASLLWGWFYLLPDEYMQLGKHTAAAGVFGSNIVLWRESGYFDAAAETKPLLHLWSLAVEEQFYLVWPVLLVLAFRWNLNRLTLMVGVVLASLVLCVVRTPGHPTGSFYLPVTRFWEIGAGALLAHVQTKGLWQKMCAGLSRMIWEELPSHARYRPWLEHTGAGAGLVLVGLGFVLLSRNQAFPGWRALVPVLGAVLVIGSGPGAWVNRVLLSNRWAVALGKISYPLYLWHWPLLVFAHLWSDEGRASRSERIAVVALSFVLAWLTTAFLEHPIRFGRWKRSKIILFIFIYFWIILFVFSEFLYSKNGFLGRLHEDIRDIFDRDFLKEYYEKARVGLFHIGEEKKFSDIKDLDFDQKKNIKKIYLWGDSNAAHLYPGLDKFKSKNFFIIQRTKSSCRPFLKLKKSFFDEKFNKDCCKFNNSVFNDIVEKKPDVVLIAASWPAYLSASSCAGEVADLCTSLYRNGVKNIFVVGPVPRWKIPLKKVIARIYMRGEDFHKRSFFLLEKNVFDYEKNFIDIKNKNFFYISALRIFCQKDGCLNLIFESNQKKYTPVAYDQHHLTTAGSEYLVSHFPDLIPELKAD